MKKISFIIILSLTFFVYHVYGQIVYGPSYRDEIINSLNDISKKDIIRLNTSLLEAGIYQNSILYIDKLLESEPNVANYNYRKGLALISMEGDIELAKQCLLKAKNDINPKYKMSNKKETGAPVETYYLLGRVAHLENRIDEAIEYYNTYKNSNVKKLVYADDVQLMLQQCDNAKTVENRDNLYRIGNFKGNVNSKYPDYAPAISSDGNNMFYTSRRPWPDGSNENIVDVKTNMYSEDIYYTTKSEDGVWNDPKMMNFCKANMNESAVSTSNGSDTIYYYNDNVGNGDLYFGIFKNEQLENTQPILISGVNSKYWDPHINFSKDGKTLYFSSNRPGGFGGRDIYKITKNSDGSWGEPVNLGPTINSEYDEDAPSIADDNVTLYFSSNGKRSIGGFDVFKTEYNVETKKWSVPENMGTPINTTYHDIYFNLSENRFAYMSSNRPGGQGGADIYQVNFVRQQIALIKGNVTYPNETTPKDPSVAIRVRCLDCEEDITVTTYDIGEIPFGLNVIPCHKYELVATRQTATGEEETFFSQIYELGCDEQQEVYADVVYGTKEGNFPAITYKHYFSYNRNSVAEDKANFERLINGMVEQANNGRQEFIISINSSASYVPTRSFKDNKTLAATRAENLKQIVLEAINLHDMLKGKVNIQIKDVSVNGPAYESDAGNQATKYVDYQFVSATLEGYGEDINSAGLVIESKDDLTIVPVDRASTSSGNSGSSGGSSSISSNDFSTKLQVGYHVVVGAFGVISNAERLADKLKASYPNTIIVKNTTRGLNYVIINSTPDRAAAIQTAEQYKQNASGRAWVLYVK
ncbi:MAG: PD40 domain-containing protein [Brumimicrobium sp.]|nr:PD40 domain-containing protein [Brumimicrobium sp.]